MSAEYTVGSTNIAPSFAVPRPPLLLFNRIPLPRAKRRAGYLPGDANEA